MIRCLVPKSKKSDENIAQIGFVVDDGSRIAASARTTGAGSSYCLLLCKISRIMASKLGIVLHHVNRKFPSTAFIWEFHTVYLFISNPIPSQ